MRTCSSTAEWPAHLCYLCSGPSTSVSSVGPGLQGADTKLIPPSLSEQKTVWLHLSSSSFYGPNQWNCVWWVTLTTAIDLQSSWPWYKSHCHAENAWLLDEGQGVTLLWQQHERIFPLFTSNLRSQRNPYLITQAWHKTCNIPSSY